MKSFLLLLPLFLYCGCTKSGNPASKGPAPVTIRFEQMTPSRGLMLPKVEIVNQTAKSINTLQFDYKCFDASGRDITNTNLEEGRHSWGMTGPEVPAKPLFTPNSTNETVVGYDKTWIPESTASITATPVWVQFADGTEWRGN